MIELYYWTTPNGHKITMFLEETGLPYTIVPVKIGAGEQFKPEFLAISPNNRIPAIIDRDPKTAARPIPVFESGAILLYLAEKTGRFIGARFARACRSAAVALLADGWAWPDGGAKPPFQPVCAGENPVCDRALCQRNKPALWRSQQAAGRQAIRGRRLLHRGHGCLSLDCSP